MHAVYNWHMTVFIDKKQKSWKRTQIIKWQEQFILKYVSSSIEEDANLCKFSSGHAILCTRIELYIIVANISFTFLRNDWRIAFIYMFVCICVCMCVWVCVCVLCVSVCVCVRVHARTCVWGYTLNTLVMPQSVMPQHQQENSLWRTYYI